MKIFVKKKIFQNRKIPDKASCTLTPAATRVRLITGSGTVRVNPAESFY